MTLSRLVRRPLAPAGLTDLDLINHARIAMPAVAAIETQVQVPQPEPQLVGARAAVDPVDLKAEAFLVDPQHGLVGFVGLEVGPPGQRSLPVRRRGLTILDARADAGIEPDVEEVIRPAGCARSERDALHQVPFMAGVVVHEADSELKRPRAEVESLDGSESRALLILHQRET